MSTNKPIFTDVLKYKKPTLEWLNRFLFLFFNAVLLLVSRRSWKSLQKIPATGGVVVISNHISFLDPLNLATALFKAGRSPKGMGKAELFAWPVVGKLFLKMGHIPIKRFSTSPADSLKPALAALQHGEVIALYPEGTINLKPENGLLQAKTGAVRLALDAKCPIVPVGQWGPQLALNRFSFALLRPVRLFGWFRKNRSPRRPVCRLLVGDPISYEQLHAACLKEDDTLDYRAGLVLVMDALATLVVEASGVPSSGFQGTGTPARILKSSNSSQSIVK